MAHRTIAITGANGFIGSYLKEYFLSKGFKVKSFQRSRLAKHDTDDTLVSYDLQLPLASKDFLKIDTLIHCAYTPYTTKCENADEINIKATERIIEMCRQHKIKIIFLSSFSAHSEAQSHYGKNKLVLEKMFDEKRDLILKLGLVVGNGGMFQKMKELLDNKYIIPLIDSGKQLVQTIGMPDLLEIFNVAIDKGITGTYNVAEEKPRSLKNIFLIIKNKDARNLFLPISSSLLLDILKITERIGIFLPFSSESVLGLKYGKIYKTINDLNTFGITAKPLEEIIAKSNI